MPCPRGVESTVGRSRSIASGHRLPSDFAEQLLAADSDLAHQLVCDPYVFDFFDLTGRAAERELEAPLMTRSQPFLLELGHGFAFVGRQYHFEVCDDDPYIDLLSLSERLKGLLAQELDTRVVRSTSFVVVELKVNQFQPETLGQLGLYVAGVDGKLRVSDQHSPTIKILLCAGRNDNVVCHSLANTSAPLAVADHTCDAPPASLRDAVSTAAELVTWVDVTVAELPNQSAEPLHKD